MKLKLIIFALLALCFSTANAQNQIVKSAAINYTNTAPTFLPALKTGSEFAIDTATANVYQYNRVTGTWDLMSRGIDVVSGATPPAYTPGRTDSKFAINAANELYRWTSGTTWACLNCTATIYTTARLSGNGSSGNPLDIAQQGATSGQVLKWNGSSWAPGTDNNTGTTYTAGTGIAISGGNVISNTGDLSATNELQNLSLAGQSLGISSGTGVTLPVVGVGAGTGISVSSVSGTVTVTNTGDTDGSDDITGSGTLNQLAYFTAAKTIGSAATLAFSPGTGALQIGNPTNSGAFLEVKTANNTSGTLAFRIANGDNATILSLANDASALFRVPKFITYNTGSAGDPAIATNGAICGLFEPAYGNLAFSSFAGEAARFFGNASRQLGIGVTSGVGKLMVKSVTSDNTTSALILQNSGGTAKWNFRSDGALIPDATITSSGTTGAQTINKVAGSVNFAAGASSLVVTNSLCSTSSLVFATVQSNDATAKSVSAVVGSGSFTLYLNAVATSETKVAFWVIN